MSAESTLKQVSLAFILVFFIFGVSISTAISSGDELGRVNLLHFIVLFVLWPFISFIFLLSAQLFSSKRSSFFIKLLLNLPFWSSSVKTQLLTLQGERRLNSWLVLQSQIAVLAFGIGCLFSFLTVLLLSDVAFVWRSTLLDSDQILPILELVALPWSVFDIAQPAQWLVNATQEIRIEKSSSNIDYGLWWQFLLLAQVTYAIIPRLISVLVSFVMFKRLPIIKQPANSSHHCVNQVIESPSLSKVLTQRPILDSYNLCCWLSINETLVTDVVNRFNAPPDNIFQVGFHGQDENRALAEKKTQLLLVAAWEPPMGELQDYLEQGEGIVMLLDHKEGQWQTISEHYVDEWRRFCANLDNWTLYVDKELK